MTDPNKTTTSSPIIRATEFSFLDDCWIYALSDGSIAKGWPGDARIPAGICLNERNRWATNIVFGVRI